MLPALKQHYALHKWQMYKRKEFSKHHRNPCDSGTGKHHHQDNQQLN